MERLRRSKLHIVVALLAVLAVCKADDCEDHFWEAWEDRVNSLHQPDNIAISGALVDAIFGVPPWDRDPTVEAAKPSFDRMGRSGSSWLIRRSQDHLRFAGEQREGALH